MFKKTVPFTAKRTWLHVDKEIELQKIASKYGFAPVIHDVEKNATNYVITMDHINALCLADQYGDDPKAIPTWIWKEIHSILLILYECEGIEYVDITGYNFIQKDKKVYIIDFGDARYKTDKPMNWFLKEFLDGDYGWNPDFA
jgi:tRNA A-37 threonylcarbamoyl transferase component Bud32